MHMSSLASSHTYSLFLSRTSWRSRNQGNTRRVKQCGAEHYERAEHYESVSTVNFLSWPALYVLSCYSQIDHTWVHIYLLLAACIDRWYGCQSCTFSIDVRNVGRPSRETQLNLCKPFTQSKVKTKKLDLINETSDLLLTKRESAIKIGGFRPAD